jgi:hypothetical protein
MRVPRTYRPGDFEAFLEKHSDTSSSRQTEHTDALRWIAARAQVHPASRQRRDPRASNRDSSDRFRTTYRDRSSEYSLCESEVQTLIKLGKFRIVPADDLARLGSGTPRTRPVSSTLWLRIPAASPASSLFDSSKANPESVACHLSENWSKRLRLRLPLFAERQGRSSFRQESVRGYWDIHPHKQRWPTTFSRSRSPSEVPSHV